MLPPSRHGRRNDVVESRLRGSAAVSPARPSSGMDDGCRRRDGQAVGGEGAGRPSADLRDSERGIQASRHPDRVRSPGSQVDRLGRHTTRAVHPWRTLSSFPHPRTPTRPLSLFLRISPQRHLPPSSPSVLSLTPPYSQHGQRRVRWRRGEWTPNSRESETCRLTHGHPSIHPIPPLHPLFTLCLGPPRQPDRLRGGRQCPIRHQWRRTGC